MPRPVPSPSLAAPRRAFAGLGASLAAGLLLGLAACAPQPPRPSFVGIAPPIGGAPAPVAQPARAAMLLPLTGPQAPLGQAMLNAGYMALFDEAPGGVEFAPRDTGGTPQGAQAAARAAIADGARVLIGPLTSGEAAMVIPAARAAGVPVLAFTNDAQRAGDGAWVLGTTPQQQVRRVVAAAAQGGAQRFALAAPDTEFGRALAVALRGATSDLGLPVPAIALHPSNADPAMAAGAARGAAGAVDALLIGESGERARRFAAGWLADTPEGQPPARLLGTALWLNDPALRSEGALGGAWFPGPDGAARARFEARYRDAFRETPPRIAAAAYDAAALAARALRSGTPVEGVTAVQPFAGADGPVRLLPGGQTLRGLAIYALSPGGDPVIVEAAPAPGGAGF
ncbi:ABC transporter substrate-binding protein [Falsiroseomonas sp. CW058]|uniref:ABC transporter substrate-binding protein n=1 Tax=Falsiroseomonas sp. CW058 TaxID=3388664 RepID=UPI003D32460F